jgi:hypothetical protein
MPSLCQPYREVDRVLPLAICLPFFGALLGAAVLALPANCAEPPGKQQVKSLFDGKTLAGWKKTAFGGEGDVEVDDGRLILHAGSPMSGITYTGEFPKTDYEITLDAMRVDGSDFFCGLTFPVGDSPCSFIVGGWGGGVVGLSSIDGSDASENETTKYQEFESKRWYPIRVRVTKDRIAAWVDNKQMVNFETADHRISIRIEVELSRPLGIATYATTAALRDIKVRRLDGEAK